MSYGDLLGANKGRVTLVKVVKIVRWVVARCVLRPDCVVLDAPLPEQNLRLPQGVEDFVVQHLIPRPGVESIAISVLPRWSRLDVGRFGTDRRDSVSHLLGNELGAVTPREEALF